MGVLEAVRKSLATFAHPTIAEKYAPTVEGTRSYVGEKGRAREPGQGQVVPRLGFVRRQRRRTEEEDDEDYEDDTDEGDVDEDDAKESDEDNNDYDSDHEAQVSIPETPEPEDLARMGAEHSKHEVNAALHATRDVLLQANGSGAAVGVTTTEKPRHSRTGLANPAYRNPMPGATSQRKLPQQNRIRQSASAGLVDSPGPPSPVTRRKAAEAATFSPLKKQRRELLRVSLPLPSAEDAELANAQLFSPSREADPATTRRSQKQPNLEAVQVPRPLPGRPGTQREVSRTGEGDLLADDDVRFKSYGRDRTLAQDLEDAALTERAAAPLEHGDTARWNTPSLNGKPETEIAPAHIHQPVEGVASRKRQRNGHVKLASAVGGPATTQSTQSENEPQKSRRRTEADAAFPNLAAEELGPSASGQKASSSVSTSQASVHAKRAVADLNRRWSSAEGRIVALERREDESEPTNTAEGPRQAPAQKIDKARREDRDNGEHEGWVENDEADEEQDGDSPNRKLSPIPGQRSTRANTGAKRRTVKRGDAEESGAEDEENQHRLFGQWAPMRCIVKNLARVGVSTIDGEETRNELGVRHEDIKAVLGLCEAVAEQLTSSRDDPGRTDESVNFAHLLDDLTQRVHGLDDQNSSSRPNRKSKQRVTSIYFHVIPKLVKLLWHAALCYEATDETENPRRQVTLVHLETLRSIVRLILDLETKAKSSTSRPDPSMAVVRPIHNLVAVPLREVHTTFSKVILHREAAIRAAAHEAGEAEARALRLEQDERQGRQQARLDQLREKWHGLHEERLRAEGGIVPAQKRFHLQIPDPCLDTDQHGRLFERMQVFHPRVGPPPGLVDAVRCGPSWDLDELVALEEGLRRYAGPRVFEKVFRKECGREGRLNRYNVTEIVTVAADLKEYLTREYAELVEEWVTRIPVWTKAHHVLGKENEGEEEDEDADVLIELAVAI